MAPLENLTLNGAVSLLTYLQFACMRDERLGAIALAATLCEMLNQLDLLYPDLAKGYGWQRTTTEHDCDLIAKLELESDRDSYFDSACIG